MAEVTVRSGSSRLRRLRSSLAPIDKEMEKEFAGTAMKLDVEGSRSRAPRREGLLAL